MIKEHSKWSQTACVQICIPPLTGCVFLSKKLNLSESQFHRLQARVVNSFYP